MTMASKTIILPGQLISPSVANSRSSILVIALWSVCLLTTFVVILGYAVRQKIMLAYRLDEREKLSLIAEAGIKKGMAQIQKEEIKAYDVLKDTWSNNQGEFREVDVGDGKFSIGYNYINELSGALETRYGLIDEERKININKIDMAVLKRLFQIVLGFDEIKAQELTASIIDWRDTDSELYIPEGSAEDSYYRDLQYPYEAKDKEFEVLEELLLVKGVTEGIFAQIRGYITIYGSGKININTASDPVLLALGLTEATVDKILSFRCGEDKVSGTADDNVFEDTSSIVPKLGQSYHLSEPEKAQITMVAERYLVTNSNNFMVISTAHLNGKKNSCQIFSVVDRTGKVLSWQQI